MTTCTDCNKRISDVSIRCCKCNGAYKKSTGMAKLVIRNRDFSGNKNPNWKGNKPKCIDCGLQLKYKTAKRCRPCASVRRDI